MKNLRNRFERFCFKHRTKGIPNLIAYIVIGCGIVSIMNMLGYSQIYSILCFDRDAVLQGQVWRLVTYIFTMSSSNIFTTLILLYCYYSLGRALESNWGTLRFNLYYLTGILLMDIYAMAFGGIDIVVPNTNMVYTNFSSMYASYMTTYLHLSMLICYATVYSETQFLLFFIIPIKAWILALIYLGITVFDVISMTVPVSLFPHNLFPLVALANYFLFFGKDVLNVFPLSWRVKLGRLFRKKPKKQTGTVEFTPVPKPQRSTQKSSYTHRCTVCGKTDVSNPELEFRYCSRCSGYFCYCEEHIGNHTHIES